MRRALLVGDDVPVLPLLMRVACPSGMLVGFNSSLAVEATTAALPAICVF